MIKKKKKVKRGAKTNLDAVRRIFSGIDEGNKFWKAKVGDNVIRILPSNRDDGNFAYHSVQHHGFKVEGQSRAFPCLGHLNKPCPVCQIISYYDTETDPDIKELMKQIGPRHSYLMNIIDKNKPDGTVMIFSAPKVIMRDIMSYMNDEEYGDITDATEGRYVKIKRTGEGLGTKYSTRVSPKATEIQEEGWEDNLFNLEREAYREVPTYKSYVKIIEANYGGIIDVETALDLDNEEEEDEDDEDSTRSTKRKNPKLVSSNAKKKKVSKKVEKDDEEEDEDDELDDVDEL